MNQSLILDLLENNARLTSQDLADILNEDEASIKSEIQSLEKNKIIDEKIKISDRDSWPVVLDATDKIVWIPGLKKSKLDKKITEEYDIVMKYY